MKVAKLLSAELEGVKAKLIEVEADLNVGLHSFNIVGLADKAVSEAKERVNSALKNSGIKPPSRENRKITINLAPANVKKAGSRFDLPIAVAYLAASKQLKTVNLNDKIFVGELSLDGSLKPIRGGLNFAILAKTKKIPFLFLPKENAQEAALIEGVKIVPITDLRELIAVLEKRRKTNIQPKTPFKAGFSPSFVKISEIKGQTAAKRALLIAAAGGHNVFMTGPPGTGKTMLSQSLISILPPPSLNESIEVTMVWSAANMLQPEKSHIDFRPFRSPHHNASRGAVLGGGSDPRPGEISLAHRGVLFLDELPEFSRDVREGLRQPLEEREIHIARAKKSLTFPANFILVGAMNPCPCGHYEDPDKECRCTANEILRYQKKISGPLMDRFDIQIEIPRIPIEELRKKREETIENLCRFKILQARKTQHARFVNFNIYTNAEMSSKQVDDLIQIDDDGEKFISEILGRAFVSPRGYYRILKIARTIADLENTPLVKREHLEEAFQYRLKMCE